MWFQKEGRVLELVNCSVHVGDRTQAPRSSRSRFGRPPCPCGSIFTESPLKLCIWLPKKGFMSLCFENQHSAHYQQLRKSAIAMSGSATGADGARGSAGPTAAALKSSSVPRLFCGTVVHSPTVPLLEILPDHRIGVLADGTIGTSVSPLTPHGCPCPAPPSHRPTWSTYHARARALPSHRCVLVLLFSLLPSRSFSSRSAYNFAIFKNTQGLA
jgi:hypothetical protein